MDNVAIHHSLYSPSAWGDPDKIHDIFALLRRESPVHLGVQADFPDLWHITKHSDIFEIERRTDVFISAPRLTIMETAREDAIRRVNGGSVHLIRSLVTMDEPEHQSMRQITQADFMPKNLWPMQGDIERVALDVVGELVDADAGCDFASEIAFAFPLRIMMNMLGLPVEDYQVMLKWTKELFGPDDPDNRPTEAPDGPSDRALNQVYRDLVGYFTRLANDRRRSPRNDLISRIANAKIDGQLISDAAVVGYCIILATAGHDTTTYTLVEAVRQLALSPSIFDALRNEPDRLAPLVANEAIRLASPTRHFLRTANCDFVLRGKRIREGQSVVLWYPSGSRDEEVFPDPNRFDPERATRVRHAAFGHGPHVCLGIHLATQEVTTFVKTLAENVSALALTGPPVFTHSNFVGGAKRLPLQATRV